MPYESETPVEIWENGNDGEVGEQLPLDPSSP